jgi:hypothetical protein
MTNHLFVFRDCLFVIELQGNGKRFKMKRTAKADCFRKCADPCPRFLTPGDTHGLCVFCLGEEHAREVLEGTLCANCERFSLKTLRSRLALFSSEEGSASGPRGSGPARAEAERRLASWGSQMELVDHLERAVILSDDPTSDEGDLQVDDEDDFSPTVPADSALQDEQEMVEEVDNQLDPEPPQPPCPVYAELVDVMERAADRLQLPWQRARGETARGRLDDRFLPGHRPPAQVSLPFLPDLHAEVRKAWKNPFSARIHQHQRASFADVEGIEEHGYVSMPPIDETFANYLVSGRASTLRAPTLPSKPLKTSARLNGRAYTAAGQAGAALHTMAVLQAYQADLLGDLDQGAGISPDAVAELRRTTDLALRATKQTAAAIGRSMAAMVATERHLWLSLADIGDKEKAFLLDSPVSPSELFGTSVEAVVGKFREAKARSAAFKTCIPLRSGSAPRQAGGPGPSRSEDYRQGQRASVTSRAPPPRRSRAQKRRDSRNRRDLREVIQNKRSQRR